MCLRTYLLPTLLSTYPVLACAYVPTSYLPTYLPNLPTTSPVIYLLPTQLSTYPVCSCSCSCGCMYRPYLPATYLLLCINVFLYPSLSLYFFLVSETRKCACVVCVCVCVCVFCACA